jgi:hypothetical protein
MFHLLCAPKSAVSSNIHLCFLAALIGHNMECTFVHSNSYNRTASGTRITAQHVISNSPRRARTGNTGSGGLCAGSAGAQLLPPSAALF